MVVSCSACGCTSCNHSMRAAIFCFPADKEAVDHCYEMRALRPAEKSSWQKVTELN